MAPPASVVDSVHESMGVPQESAQPTWEWRELGGKSIKYDLTQPTKAASNLPHWTMVALQHLPDVFPSRPPVFSSLPVGCVCPGNFD
jgi:hypothetical protein